MKKLILSAAACVILFAACEKEKVQPQQTPSQAGVSPASTSVYYYNGKEVSINSLPSANTESHWLVIESNGKINNYIFDTETELESFAKTTSYGRVITDKLTNVRAARAYAAQHHSIEQFEQTGIVPEDYSSYLRTASGAASKSFGIGVLHDNLNASGSIFPITGSPQATLPGFDNRAESASGVGLANTVWDKTFFRGSSRYLLLGTGTYVNFDGLGFQNVTSSEW